MRLRIIISPDDMAETGSSENLVLSRIISIEHALASNFDFIKVLSEDIACALKREIDRLKK